MKETVVIKGTKSGIILVLDAACSWETLKVDIAEKFQISAAFLGDAQKAISFQGKTLSEEEQIEAVEIIQANCELKIICIMEEDEKVEAKFAAAIEKEVGSPAHVVPLEAISNEVPKGPTSDYTGFFFKGNLRSGQILDVETSIIIIGDVNAGATVVSKGNIVILGALKGNAIAGAGGNVDAFVIALDMNPVQIRIADTIARSPDEPVKNRIKETKIAFWEDGNIYIEPLDKNVISDIRLS